MKTNKNSMKTSKTSTRSPEKTESSQPSNRDHQSPREDQQSPARRLAGAVTKKTFEAIKAASQWRGVFCDGPISHKPNEETEEIPTWIVFIGTKERQLVSKTYLCHSIQRAKTLAGVMARDRGMELIDEATTA